MKKQVYPLYEFRARFLFPSPHQTAHIHVKSFDGNSVLHFYIASTNSACYIASTYLRHRLWSLICVFSPCFFSINWAYFSFFIRQKPLRLTWGGIFELSVRDSSKVLYVNANRKIDGILSIALEALCKECINRFWIHSPYSRKPYDNRHCPSVWILRLNGRDTLIQ